MPVGRKIEALAYTAKLSEERRLKLETAKAELATFYQKVKESDELKTQFFANVIHELRTPLALILGPAERLTASDHLSEDDRHQAHVMLRNARPLLKHVNDFIDVSKLETGRMKPDYAQTDLTKLVRVTAAHFETVMQQRQIFFSLSTPDDLEVEIDPDKMQRVLMDPLSNAVKFTLDGGRIRLVVQSLNGDAAIRVEDTGTGIRPELREAVF